MKQRIFQILENVPLTSNVYKLVLSGDVTYCNRPGSFVNIKLPSLYLRRPISICDATNGKLTLIYKVVGEGTKILSNMSEGKLDILVDLGNGYDLSKSQNAPLLIGGGVGVPPLYLLAKKLIQEGKEVNVILGFNNKNEILYENEFKKLGCNVTVTTVDGSYGVKGFVTDVLNKYIYTYVYTCGPLPMLKAVYKSTITGGQYSFEERMGCGFGACMGCTCKTNLGNKRVCKDGPVFEKEEILW